VTTRLVAGVDSSTQSTKVLIVDADDGRVVAEGRAEHTVTGSGGARESDPEQWWSALRAALADTGRAHEIGAISVAAQQHGLVTLDGKGAVVRPAMLWNDTRSAADAAALLEALGGPGEWAERIGTVPVASITATKWAWLRRTEPEHAARTAAIRLPHDYLTGLLCGRGVTDRGDASGSGWFSTATDAYSPEVLSLPGIQLDPGVLPAVEPPDAPVGEVTRAAAEDLGLSGAPLVGVGTGDNMGAALGLGLTPGQPVVSLGTSGTAYAVSTRRPADGSGTVAGFADASGVFLPLAATLNCTVAVDWFAAWLGIDREATEPGGEVTVLPFLDGERTPNLPLATGLVTGLRHDTTSGQVLRAVYEGAAHALLAALGEVSAHGSGIPDDEPLVLIGGGAQGKAWLEVIRRLSGRPVVVPDTGELVALGAAAQAAACLTGTPAPELARTWDTRHGAAYEPLPADTATADRITAVLHSGRELLA
jgi:xylulokinase